MKEKEKRLESLKKQLSIRHNIASLNFRFCREIRAQIKELKGVNHA